MLPEPPPPPCEGTPCNGECCPPGLICDPEIGCTSPPESCDAATCVGVCCKDTCTLPCNEDEVFNSDTCACECAIACGNVCCQAGQACDRGGAGQEPVCCEATCGNVCCRAGQTCAEGGPDLSPPVCCDRGKLCGDNLCKGHGDFTCCKTGPSPGGFSCPSAATCCGKGGCCSKATQTCRAGKCVKKKKPKHKHK